MRLAILTKRDDQVHLFPGTKRDERFSDRPPPKHALREPLPSKELRHHRKHAARLAALRGEPYQFSLGARMTRNEFLTDLKVLAIWKREWETRAESAQFQFETIGLDAELHDAIIRRAKNSTSFIAPTPNAFPAALVSLHRVWRPHDGERLKRPPR